MIRVTVELISAINPARSRVLGVAEIANDLSSDNLREVGNYKYRLSKWSPKLRETWKKGRVTGLSRTKRGSWDLLFMVLRDAVGKRNPISVVGGEG